jgi:hypothetical protein
MIVGIETVPHERVADRRQQKQVLRNGDEKRVNRAFDSYVDF